MEQQDSFQAAIDYLIANRKKPVFNNQGLFTQPAQPAPATKPSVVTGLFGDEYIRKNRNRDSGDSEFIGNPNSEFTPRNGLSSLTDAARYRDMASGIRKNQDAISAGFGLLSKVNPVFGLLGVGVRYGAPKLFDYLGDRAYNRYGQEMQQIGGEIFNPANPNFANLAYNDPNYDAYRSDFPAGGVTYAPGSPATFYNDPNYDAYRSDANVIVGDPIDTSPIQGTSLDSGGGGFSDTYSDAGGGSFDYSADTGYDR
jgi:hypothetical protein